MQRGFNVLILLFALTVHAFAETGSNYEIVARLSQAPGNVTVTGSGRIIMSQHQFYEPDYSVVERQGDGSLTPFPNKELNDRQNHSDLTLDLVLGIRTDVNGVVWMLDDGMRSGVTPKLVGWDTKTDKLHRVIYLPAPIAPKDAFVNDFTVDSRHNRIFIVDPAGGANAAFIVVDLETGAARRVLEGHPSVVPEKVDLIIDGRPIQVKDATGHLVRPRIGVDPVTEDLQNEWVYFGPMHGSSFIASRRLIWPMKGWTRKRSVKRWSATVPNPSATESASTRTTISTWAIWRKTRLASSSRIEAI